jgi:glycosyltransferase involved in cell wall biosynthesis
MNRIFYWCPFLNKVATVKAVINSCIGIKKYSNLNEPTILNAVGEFDEFKNEIKSENIDIINLGKKNIINILPKLGFLKSRFSYMVIFFLTFRKLKNLLINKKPDYLIVHLITSLPILLFIIYNFETKLILRISGLPKLNFLRKLLWKVASKNIYLVTTPTVDTKKHLLVNKIFKSNQVTVIRDPILSIKKISILRKGKIEEQYLAKKKFIVSIGRLTHQKNFDLLINNFLALKKITPFLKLIILGEGEQRQNLFNLIKKKRLTNEIFLLGQKDNVYKYLDKCFAFLLSSRWEDPGFVLLEAIACRSVIISSDCENGPKEILNNGEFGYMFKNKNGYQLIQRYKDFTLDETKKINLMKLGALKNARKFTIFNHAKALEKILIK